MSKACTIVEISTGRLLGVFTGSDRQLAVNTPDGCIAVDGAYDKESQRYDFEKMAMVDFQPPIPSPDHEWIHDDPQTGRRVRRWKLKAEIESARAQKTTARAQIIAIEQSQQRSIRELALDPTNEIARAKLAESDARIAELREVLATNTVNSIG